MLGGGERDMKLKVRKSGLKESEVEGKVLRKGGRKIGYMKM